VRRGHLVEAREHLLLHRHVAGTASMMMSASDSSA
jgi:hypothetical protein